MLEAVAVTNGGSGGGGNNKSLAGTQQEDPRSPGELQLAKEAALRRQRRLEAAAAARRARAPVEKRWVGPVGGIAMCAPARVANPNRQMAGWVSPHTFSVGLPPAAPPRNDAGSSEQ